MTYEAVFLNVFLKQFMRLASNLRERVGQRVQEIAGNPYLGLRLRGELQGFWKDRIGEYRIIYKVDEANRRIVFHDVDLRKRV